MKRLLVIILGVITALVSLTTNAQGNSGKIKPQNLPQGQFMSIPVDFSAVGNNYTTLAVIDLETNYSYSITSLDGVNELIVPKNSTYFITFTMSSSEATEFSYWLDWGSAQEGIGVTVQPWSSQQVGTYAATLSNKSSFTFIRR